MTSKCKCGHDRKEHLSIIDKGKLVRCMFGRGVGCDCEKFQVEDEISDELKYDKDLWGKHTLTKQKKGCGKRHPLYDLHGTKCGDTQSYKYLCPSCQNQSPQENNSEMDSFNHKPEDTFNLSDKMVDYSTVFERGHEHFFKFEDVKEFIRRLKEELTDWDKRHIPFMKTIDKLAGYKLLEGVKE